MAKKIKITENAIVVTDTITNKVVFDAPKSRVYYLVDDLNRDIPYVCFSDANEPLNSKPVYKIPLSECIDSFENPFTVDSFIEFTHDNLGFKNGGAVSESGAIESTSVIVKNVEVVDYPTALNTILITSLEEFETQALINSHPPLTELVIQEGLIIDSSDLTRRFDVMSSDLIIRGENPENKNVFYFSDNSSHIKYNNVRCFLIDCIVHGDLITISQAVPNTVGIVLDNAHKFQAFNCEVYGFSYAAFDAKNTRDAVIHHNYIHECRREGLGYGTVLNGDTTVEFHNNEYDLNRHNVAMASDSIHQGYIARNNYERRAGFPVHRFDAHAEPDPSHPSGVSRYAGAFIEIYNNYFEEDPNICFVTRGVQRDRCLVYGNTFCRPNRATSIRQTIQGEVIGANQEENIIDFDNLYITKLDDDISNLDNIVFQNSNGLYTHNMGTKLNTLIANIPFFRKGGLIEGDFLSTNDTLLINGSRVQIFIDGFVKTIDITYNGNIDIVTKGRISQDVKDELLISTDTGDVYGILFDQVGNNPPTATVTLLLSGQNIKSIILGYYVDATPLHDIILINNIDEFYLLQNVAGVYGSPTQLTSAIDLTGFDKIFKMDLFNNGGTDDFVGLKNDSIYRFRMLGGAIRSGDPFVTTSPFPTNTNYFVKKINGNDRFFAFNESGYVKIYKTASGFTSVNILDVSYIGVIDAIQS